jgi:hypothetical protein
MHITAALRLVGNMLDSAAKQHINYVCVAAHKFNAHPFRSFYQGKGSSARMSAFEPTLHKAFATSNRGSSVSRRDLGRWIQTQYIIRADPQLQVCTYS